MTFLSDLLEFLNTEVTLDPAANIAPDTDLLLTGLVDSLGVIRIVYWLEDTLGVTIEPVDVVLDNFQTVDQMVAYIGRLGVTVI